ncbi:hypothetical protein T492DRAFT_902975, partial [Pavlovales sp. CCMP2436]
MNLIKVKVLTGSPSSRSSQSRLRTPDMDTSAKMTASYLALAAMSPAKPVRMRAHTGGEALGEELSVVSLSGLRVFGTYVLVDSGLHLVRESEHQAVLNGKVRLAIRKPAAEPAAASGGTCRSATALVASTERRAPEVEAEAGADYVFSTTPLSSTSQPSSSPLLGQSAFSIFTLGAGRTGSLAGSQGSEVWAEALESLGASTHALAATGRALDESGNSPGALAGELLRALPTAAAAAAELPTAPVHTITEAVTESETVAWMLTPAAGTGAADAGAAGAGAADTRAADTRAVDTGAADTGAADTGAADTEPGAPEALRGVLDALGDTQRTPAKALAAAREALRGVLHSFVETGPVETGDAAPVDTEGADTGVVDTASGRGLAPSGEASPVPLLIVEAADEEEGEMEDAKEWASRQVSPIATARVFVDANLRAAALLPGWMSRAAEATLPGRGAPGRASDATGPVKHAPSRSRSPSPSPPSSPAGVAATAGRWEARAREERRVKEEASGASHSRLLPPRGAHTARSTPVSPTTQQRDNRQTRSATASPEAEARAVGRQAALTLRARTSLYEAALASDEFQ